MKKIATLSVIALSALLLTACGNKTSHNSGSDSAKSEKTVEANKGFSDGAISNKKGTLLVTSVRTLSASDPSVDGQIKAVVFRGTFTNKTKSGISANAFFNQYVQAYSVGKVTNKRLSLDGLQVDSPYDKDISTAHDETNSNQTSHFAVAYEVPSLAQQYKLTALDSGQNSLGSETFNATSTPTMTAKSSSSSEKANNDPSANSNTTAVSLSQSQDDQINSDFLNWASDRASIGHMAVSDWYFDHGAAGQGDWYANTPDGEVQAQDNDHPGKSAFKIHAIGGCVFYKSKDGATGKQDLEDGGSLADNYELLMDTDKPVSKYLLGDNGTVYELKSGNGTIVTTSTGFGEYDDDGTEGSYKPDQDFQVSQDTAAQAELKSLINQYK